MTAEPKVFGKTKSFTSIEGFVARYSKQANIQHKRVPCLTLSGPSSAYILTLLANTELCSFWEDSKNG